MSWRGLAKRLKSPTSAATVTATIWPTPRIAWSACTTGASDQQGSKAMICSASPRHPLRGILDGVEVVLQHDLLGRDAGSAASSATADRPGSTPFGRHNGGHS